MMVKASMYQAPKFIAPSFVHAFLAQSSLGRYIQYIYNYGYYFY